MKAPIIPPQDQENAHTGTVGSGRPEKTYISKFAMGGELFYLLTGLCVYAWRREGEILYVGHTMNGLSRVTNHNIIGNVEMIGDDDLIELWAFDDWQKAVRFEKALIERYVPKYNKTAPNEQGSVGKKKLICPKCGKAFFPRRWWQKFCSRACQVSKPDQEQKT